MQWQHKLKKTGFFYCRNWWKRYHVFSKSGVTLWCRRYALCMNETRVRCAPELRRHYPCKIIWIHWKFSQRNCVTLFHFLLDIASLFSFFKHITKKCCLCIERSVQFECLDQKAIDRNRFIWWAIETCIATKYSYELMSAFNKIIKFAKFDTIQMKKESFEGMRRNIEYLFTTLRKVDVCQKKCTPLRLFIKYFS